MKINQEVKRLIHLINTLLPKYEFDIPMKANVFTYIDIGCLLPNLKDAPRYIGTILLNRVHPFPFKSTDIILSLPTHSSSKKLIEEWKSIGIVFEADKRNSDEDFYHYYKIELKNDENQ